MGGAQRTSLGGAEEERVAQAGFMSINIIQSLYHTGYNCRLYRLYNCNNVLELAIDEAVTVVDIFYTGLPSRSHHPHLSVC